MKHTFSSLAKCILSATTILAISACTKSTKPELPAPVKVTVMAVGGSGQDSTLTGNSSAQYSGTVESSANTNLSFNIPGIITAIYVEEGQKVQKGQALAKIRSNDYENTYNIAKAELAEAEDAYSRLKKLHDADALPDIKWVEVQNKLKQAKSAAQIAAQSVSDATLRAPYSGVIGRKIAEVGQTVITSEPVLQLVTVGNPEIHISIPENEIGSVTEGMAATVSFPSINLSGINAKVIRKTIVADPLTRAYAVKLSIPANDRILPGMVCYVAMDIAKDNATDSTANATSVILPSQAVLLSSDNRNFVWIVSKGCAQQRFVTANDLTSGGIEITSGISRGDSVIIAGMQKVGTGTKVTAITE